MNVSPGTAAPTTENKMPTAAEINAARETLNTLRATFPDLNASERADHELAYEIAYERFCTLMDRARREKAQTMTDDAGKVVTRFGFPVHKDGLCLRIADQWAQFGPKCYARIDGPYRCRRKLGGYSTIRQDGKKWIVTLFDEDGWRTTHTCSTYGSAFKIMVRW
jgi:hypothetical protein